VLKPPSRTPTHRSPRLTRQLASDSATLTQDATALNTDSTLAGDIQQIQTDLATEQSDYQTELSDSCIDNRPHQEPSRSWRSHPS
jgi:hypothetical protein